MLANKDGCIVHIKTNAWLNIKPENFESNEIFSPIIKDQKMKDVYD